MDNIELISIITPAYNAALFIGQTIDSVVAQSYTHWELIIVDDGSSDQTATIVKEYAKKDPRIQYVYQTNGRQGKARNNGLRKAKGKYIAFLDADDLWEKEKLSVQLATLKKSDVDLVFSDAFLFSDHPSKNQRMNTNPQLFKGVSGLKQFMGGNKIPILTVLATKESILTCGGFIEDLAVQNAEDYHLWLHMIILGKSFLSIEGPPLAYYRLHSSAVTVNDKEAIQPAIQAILNLAERYPEYQYQLLGSIPQKIDYYLINTIITNQPLFSHLIEIRNRYSPKPIISGFWIGLFKLAPYRILRKLYHISNSS
jgi:teichuronic acid biosynthesis glycosyltransferase TuaG